MAVLIIVSLTLFFNFFKFKTCIHIHTHTHACMYTHMHARLLIRSLTHSHTHLGKTSEYHETKHQTNSTYRWYTNAVFCQCPTPRWKWWRPMCSRAWQPSHRMWRSLQPGGTSWSRATMRWMATRRRAWRQCRSSRTRGRSLPNWRRPETSWCKSLWWTCVCGGWYMCWWGGGEGGMFMCEGMWCVSMWFVYMCVCVCVFGGYVCIWGMCVCVCVCVCVCMPVCVHVCVWRGGGCLCAGMAVQIQW